MRRTAAAALAGLALAGCFKPTWRRVEPGQPLAPDTVVVVGSFAADPTIDQHHVKRDCTGTWVNGRYEPPGKVVFVQETDGNVMAFFTRNLSEPFEAATHTTPSRAGFDWFYMPLSGHFFIELPRAKRLNLRGFTYLTNAGSRMFDLPAYVDLAPSDRVVYVGEIHVRRGDGRRATFVNAMEGARRAAREKGLTQLAGAPWTVRLLQTPAGRPSISPEFGDSCTAEKGYWKQLL
jgi:hypothetical protein